MLVYSRERQRLVEIQPAADPREGGEGWIYQTAEAGLLAKVFKEPGENDRREKIEALLKTPPHDPPTKPGGHRRYAWPQEILLEKTTGAFIGYTMREVQHSRPLHEFYDPAGSEYRDRAFRVRLAITLAELIADIHRHPLMIVVGDINPNNILADGLGRAALIDIDSAQLTTIEGDTYFCPVGSSEYLPAELLAPGLDLRRMRRRQEHDQFGLAVLIFRLLFDGLHAFAAVGSPEPLPERIRAGAWPYLRGSPEKPPVGAPVLEAFPKEIQAHLTRTFVEGHWRPTARLSAEDWVEALTTHEKALGRHVGGDAPAGSPPRKRALLQRGVGGPAAALVAASFVAVGVRNFVGVSGGNAADRGRVSAVAVTTEIPRLEAGVQVQPRPRAIQGIVTQDGGGLPQGPTESLQVPSAGLPGGPTKGLQVPSFLPPGPIKSPKTPRYWERLRDGGGEELSFGAAIEEALKETTAP